MSAYTIKTDKSQQITENDLILALFGMPVSEVVKEIRAGKDDKYIGLFQKTTEQTSA